MIEKYIKKPLIIEAVQYNGKNDEEIIKWSNKIIIKTDNILTVKTLEGIMTVGLNDYIIKGINGEFYPCKSDIFEKSYEKVK